MRGRQNSSTNMAVENRSDYGQLVRSAMAHQGTPSRVALAAQAPLLDYSPLQEPFQLPQGAADLPALNQLADVINEHDIEDPSEG